MVPWTCLNWISGLQRHNGGIIQCGFNLRSGNRWQSWQQYVQRWSLKMVLRMDCNKLHFTTSWISGRRCVTAGNGMVEKRFAEHRHKYMRQFLFYNCSWACWFYEGSRLRGTTGRMRHTKSYNTCRRRRLICCLEKLTWWRQMCSVLIYGSSYGYRSSLGFYARTRSLGFRVVSLISERHSTLARPMQIDPHRHPESEVSYQGCLSTRETCFRQTGWTKNDWGGRQRERRDRPLAVTLLGDTRGLLCPLQLSVLQQSWKSLRSRTVRLRLTPRVSWLAKNPGNGWKFHNRTRLGDAIVQRSILEGKNVMSRGDCSTTSVVLTGRVQTKLQHE